ncbi:hypothetical protein SBV1_270038 [Verrucomicrobia bacterium]|nr:hypothetical protein SBV1_270038 [Verrucomicrobiota bacterium]
MPTANQPGRLRFSSLFCRVAGALGLAVGLFLGGDLLIHPLAGHSRDQLIECYNNQQSIVVAFKLWASEHSNHLPFNVSSNAGGTKELCRIGQGGSDWNEAAHFRAISNELASPSFLVCPNDHNRKPAADFQQFRQANISYLLRSGANVDLGRASEVLLVCPIDGNVLYCNGNGQFAIEAKGVPRPPLSCLWQRNESFRRAATQILILLFAAGLLIALGFALRRGGAAASTSIQEVFCRPASFFTRSH